MVKNFTIIKSTIVLNFSNFFNSFNFFNFSNFKKNPQVLKPADFCKKVFSYSALKCSRSEAFRFLM